MTRILTVLLAFAMGACSDDSAERKIAYEREQQKSQEVFAAISRSWQFRTVPMNVQSENLRASWEPWRIFLRELEQKPQSTITAFRAKSKLLSTRAQDLQNIPTPYNRPEVISRISVLRTKIHELDLYINLNRIPRDKVTVLVSEINAEIASFQSQLAEIARRNQIPREQGESDLIRMRDTSRAIPGPSKPMKFE